MNNDNDILSDYLQSLYGIEPLSIKEEHDLAKKIQAGDEQALEKLITHNLRFVVYVVRKMTAWHHGKLPMEDLIAIGNECLLISAKRWKPIGDAGFSSYARSFIEKGVRRELDNTSNMIRLPVNIMQAIRKMSYNERALSQSLGRDPTVAELADAMDVTIARIYQLKGYINREPISLDLMNNEKHAEEKEE